MHKLHTLSSKTNHRADLVSLHSAKPEIIKDIQLKPVQLKSQTFGLRAMPGTAISLLDLLGEFHRIVLVKLEKEINLIK